MRGGGKTHVVCFCQRETALTVHQRPPSLGPTYSIPRLWCRAGKERDGSTNLSRRELKNEAKQRGGRRRSLPAGALLVLSLLLLLLAAAGVAALLDLRCAKSHCPLQGKIGGVCEAQSRVLRRCGGAGQRNWRCILGYVSWSVERLMMWKRGREMARWKLQSRPRHRSRSAGVEVQFPRGCNFCDRGGEGRARDHFKPGPPVHHHHLRTAQVVRTGRGRVLVLVRCWYNRRRRWRWRGLLVPLR